MSLFLRIISGDQSTINMALDDVKGNIGYTLRISGCVATGCHDSYCHTLETTNQ